MPRQAERDGETARGLPALYLISDRHGVPGGDLLGALDRALSAGVRMVQLREKDLCARDLLALARDARRLTQRHGALLLINDRVDVALAAEADGVHLPSMRPPVAAVRRLLGERALIGVSTHSDAEIFAAHAGGASFVTFGPVFDTPSKRGMGAPLGLARLRDAVRRAPLPVFALGGIGPGQVRETVACGGHGIALISAVLAQPDPQDAVRSILCLMSCGGVSDNEMRG